MNLLFTSSVSHQLPVFIDSTALLSCHDRSTFQTLWKQVADNVGIYRYMYAVLLYGLDVVSLYSVRMHNYMHIQMAVTVVSAVNSIFLLIQDLPQTDW